MLHTMDKTLATTSLTRNYNKEEYGEEGWLTLTAAAGCEQTVFNTFQTYPDHLIGDLAQAAGKTFRTYSKDGFLRHFGRCFVKFFSNFGYEEMIKATGKNFTDFLDNIDNIHVQMQFTYPRMDSPSIFLTDVDENGSVLVYRSFRNGFKEYLLGQLLEIADSLFNIHLKIELLEESANKGPGRSVQLKMWLNYDNRSYMATKQQHASLNWNLPPLTTSFLLELFPYGLIFGPALRILGAGVKLRKVFPDRKIISTTITSLFRVKRPKAFQFSWKNITSCQTVSFELELKESAKMKNAAKNILLSGQMKLLEPVSVVAFLCSPAARNIADLKDMGLFLDDLNEIGLGADLVVKGWKHAKRVDDMREKTARQCEELEANYVRMKEWKEKGDKLLYSMIPRTVAEQLKAGTSPLETCKDFEQVTIMFAEVCGLSFTDSMDELMQVVENMNKLFTKFDKATDEFDVYKVETVGEVYMAVSGAPEVVSDHAGNVAKFSLRLVQEISGEGSSIDIRIGSHSGEVVGGVVGTKLPRYCLFGDTVNTASRMQSTSLPGRIQISSATKALLPEDSYIIEPRGTIQVKGKGEMETYWLLGMKK